MHPATSSASSRNSSINGSLISRNSSKHIRKPRPHVSDIVLITSTSKVCVNYTDEGEGLICDGDSGASDQRDKDMVSEAIRNSKDLPKIRNKIFEESLESQEVSFYIDEDPESFYDKLETECEYDSYDSFEDESDSEHYQNTVVQATNIQNWPLPQLPTTHSHGIGKFTKNIKRFKKNISKDLGKSLRRFSKRVSQIYPDIEIKAAEPPREDQPAPISHVKAEDIKTHSSRTDQIQKPTSFLSRIRRSMSMTSETSLLNINRTDDQRKSTFYLTEPFDADGGIEIVNSKNTNNYASTPMLPTQINKTKLVRPKCPPPPVPVDADADSRKKSSLAENQEKSLYTEAGLFKETKRSNRSNSSTSWYSEAGLYQSNISKSNKTQRDVKNYANVINELNLKLSESSNESSGINNNGINEFNGNCYNAQNESAYNNGSVLSENSSRSKTEKENESNYNNLSENDNNYYNYSVCSFNSNDSKKDDSSLTYARNNMKFLEDEPLYQFYDAAVLEGLYSDDFSEFDCEIYEDIGEEETNEEYISSSPLDQSLNKEFSSSRDNITSFTRSLWCEVPEVVNSAVLSQLNQHQKKLQEAKFEIITSEASYLNSLNVLHDHFIPKFKTSNIVNEREFHILFGKVKEVRNSSKKILCDLEKCWKKNILLDGICDVIQKHAEESFDVYIPYCENQVLLGDTLGEMRKRQNFQEFLIELESTSLCQFLSLYSFLMLPMQRITRWPLLVDAILKRLSQTDPEYLSCQHALACVNKIVNQCNEAARKREREVELERIAQAFEFSQRALPFNVIMSNRWLVKSGSLTWYQPRSEDSRMTFGRRFNKSTIHLFLFNDLCVVSKKKSDTCYTVLHYCPRNLIEMRNADMFSVILKKEAQEKNVIYLTILENQEGKTLEFLLAGSSESERERWIEAFSPPKSENPDETVYECWDCPQVIAVHNYNACQPDELSLSRGDVINVLRKMTDGWYNGERTRDGQTGWFPSNYTSEIINPHVRARNLKQRYRLLTFSEHYLKT